MLASMGFGSILMKFKKKWKGTVTFFGIILVVLIFIDLYLVGSSYNGPVPLKTWLAQPETAKFLKEDKNNFRIYSIGQIENWFKIYNNYSHGWRSNTAPLLLSARTILDPNTNIIWNINQADGYVAIPTRRFAYLESLLNEGVKDENGKISISSPSAKLLNIQNIKYVVTTGQINDKKFDLKFETEDQETKTTYRVYQNKNNLPRVRLVGKKNMVRTVRQLAEEIQNEKFDPEESVILEKAISLDSKDTRSANVSLMKETNQKLIIEVDSKDGGILVLGDSFYPGWKAYVDGKETEILAANINQRAIVVPEGKHQVRFIFDPLTFKIGWIISLSTFMILVIISLFTFLKSRTPSVSLLRVFL
jgi:uncharacterized membrane protein YfhO